MSKVRFEKISEKEKKKVLQAYHQVIELMQRENDRIVRQNEIEIMRQKGKSCFDTAMEGAKTFRKELKK